jgi:hypothetical protein
MTMPTTHGRLFRALAAFSAHTAEIYTAVWGAEAQRAPRRRSR